MSGEYCHSDDVTRVHVDTADTPIGSTIMIDGKCYMKTGLTGPITHQLNQIESYSTTCATCSADALSGEAGVYDGSNSS